MMIIQNSQKRARIEMIPLIDVVFLLLVFFIYAMLSMVMHRGINVNLPRAESSTVDRKDYMSIAITEKGEIYLDDEKISLKEMDLLFTQQSEEAPDTRVFIRGDRGVRYERIIEVLDVVRKAGLQKVSLETASKEDRGD